MHKSAKDRGYSWAWQKARIRFLTAHPLCAMCKSHRGRLTIATLVDHIVRHKGDKALFWDEKNWQSLSAMSRRQNKRRTGSSCHRNSVCYQYHEYAERAVFEKQGDRDFDDEFFAYVCGLDEGDDPFKDESSWIKANPNLGVSVTLKYLRKQVREARGMPAKASIVRRLNFLSMGRGIESLDRVQRVERLRG